ncbi:hypothetical protein A2U01_0110960, partial [Trifolium medium]|nr:hypothetical protein [Trifolium medium]
PNLPEGAGGQGTADAGTEVDENGDEREDEA